MIDFSKYLKAQVFCLCFFFFSSFVFSQKELEISVNIGKSNSWAVPSPSKYLYYSKNNSVVTQYTNFKLLYSITPFFQMGIGKNTGVNSFNFGFYNSSLSRRSSTFFGKNQYSVSFNQIFLPLQFNFFNKYVFEPYIGLAPTFSYQQSIGIFTDSQQGHFEDVIQWTLTEEGIKTKSWGYMAYSGLKIHLFKRLIFKMEAGYSYTSKVFCKATLDYTYNGVDFKNIDFRMHNSFTYYTLGISYKLKLIKSKIKDQKE